MNRNRDYFICFCLVLGTFIVFAQVLHFQFVSFDDPDYVTANPFVQQGLSWDAVRWAWTSHWAANWHPLTWMSHMLDWEVFGPRAPGHHLTSLLLHALNTLLLFGLLRFSTGRPWPSAFVAALFAVHPLHVESVAWVAERKDVLSTALGLGAILAYTAYARKRRWPFYFLTLLLGALSLLAKPMLVTLPALLLLLDAWPLGRLRGWGRGTLLILLEKAPLAALSAASCAVTWFVQRADGAMRAAAAVPWPQRAANAGVSYVRYIAGTICPTDLGVHYTHPNLPGGTPWAWWQVAGAAVLLISITAVVIRFRRSHPYALMGWLWFLVALVPVLGLIQVGESAMNDRSMYVPAIGLFIVAAFGAERVLGRWPRHRGARLGAWAGAGIILLALGTGSWAQAQHWRDSESLYRRALLVSPTSPLMHNNLAIVLKNAGAVEEAEAHLERALAIHPTSYLAHYNLGNLRLVQGRDEAAERHYRQALEARPDHVLSHVQLGTLLLAQERFEEAAAHLEEAVRLRPDLATGMRRAARDLLARPHITESEATRARVLADVTALVRSP